MIGLLCILASGVYISGPSFCSTKSFAYGCLNQFIFQSCRRTISQREQHRRDIVRTAAIVNGFSSELNVDDKPDEKQADCNMLNAVHIIFSGSMGHEDAALVPTKTSFFRKAWNVMLRCQFVLPSHQGRRLPCECRMMRPRMH